MSGVALGPLVLRDIRVARRDDERGEVPTAVASSARRAPRGAGFCCPFEVLVLTVLMWPQKARLVETKIECVC